MTGEALRRRRVVAVVAFVAIVGCTLILVRTCESQPTQATSGKIDVTPTGTRVPGRSGRGDTAELNGDPAARGREPRDGIGGNQTTAAPGPDLDSEFTKVNRFEVPRDSAARESGREIWARKNLCFHPECVVEIPGAFVDADLSVHSEVFESGAPVAPLGPVEFVRVDSSSIVAILRTPKPSSAASVRIVLNRGVDSVDEVALNLRNRGAFLPIEARGHVSRLVGFEPESSVLRRAFERAVRSGVQVRSAAESQMEPLSKITQLLLKQYRLELAVNERERRDRAEVLILIEQKSSATRKTLEDLVRDSGSQRR